MQLLILGGGSEIGLAIAHKFARAEGAHVYLASRDTERSARKAADLEVRYQVKASEVYFDATDYASHRPFYQGLEPKPDSVILAFGYLGDQRRGQMDFTEAGRILEINLLGGISILEIIAADFEAKGRGFIAGISSVAGERGRQSNYLYGSAKGALTIYLSGLRNRLWPSNVRVLTVLPGFVRTKMTANMSLPKLLLAEPEQVAEDVYNAFKKRKDIVYSKWFWRWIMLGVQGIPEVLFKRARL
jgi:decaprenylphospho-beta-D-erythro-pentofuranosid-2-ulose 2-reductase